MSATNKGRIQDWIRYVNGNAQGVDTPNLDEQLEPQIRESKAALAGFDKGDVIVKQGVKPTAGERDASVKRRVRQRPETRAQMLDRLSNPTISLHEASVILNVCTATVRRYANEGLLLHERTAGGQRRFRLRAVMAYLRENETRRR